MRGLTLVTVLAAVSFLGSDVLGAEAGVPGEQVAASVEVPANMNIWKRRDRSKKETPEEKAKRRLLWLEDRVDPDSTERLRYWLYLPEDYAAKKKCPLILFLHGAGERGDNLDKVKAARLVDLWTTSTWVTVRGIASPFSTRPTASFGHASCLVLSPR